MRIVYLHQYFNTRNMPGSTRSYEIARRIVRSGHEVDMITSWREPTDETGWFTTLEDGIRVHWLPLRYANEMRFSERIVSFCTFAWQAARRAAAVSADVVYATSTPLTIAIPAIVASRRLGVPYVFEVRDVWPDVPIALGALRNPLLISIARLLERQAYRRAAHIVTLAPGMRDDIVAKGVSAEKISVVPNGCDLDLFDGFDSGEGIRRRYPWLGKRKLVVYAGALGSVNGVDYLAQLAGRVSALNPEIRFVVFGQGHERAHVETLARGEGILDKSFFMFAPVAKRELAPWLRAADMHVALMRGPEIYLKDAVNNKFFDALAAGKPIANNFRGWQTQIAAEAGIGVELDPDDVDLAARTLVESLENDAWLAAASARARKLAMQRFDRDAHAKEIEKILVNVAGASADNR